MNEADNVNRNRPISNRRRYLMLKEVYSQMPKQNSKNVILVVQHVDLTTNITFLTLLF